MNIDRFCGSRFELAFELFTDGREALQIGDLSLRLDEKKGLICAMESTYCWVHATDDSVRRDALEAARLLEEVVTAVPSIAERVADLPVTYAFGDGSGHGYIHVCSVRPDGSLDWW